MCVCVCVCVCVRRVIKNKKRHIAKASVHSQEKMKRHFPRHGPSKKLLIAILNWVVISLLIFYLSIQFLKNRDNWINQNLKFTTSKNGLRGWFYCFEIFFEPLQSGIHNIMIQMPESAMRTFNKHVYIYTSCSMQVHIYI